MENASKALIIAAAILIAIVLITLGVYVIGVGQNQIKNSGMSDIEITAFNQKFTKYEGSQKGSAIRTLVQEVMSNNNSSEASDETRVAINVKNRDKNLTAKANASLVRLDASAGAQPIYGNTGENIFSNTKTYTVSFLYAADGRVAVIEVK